MGSFPSLVLGSVSGMGPTSHQTLNPEPQPLDLCCFSSLVFWNVETLPAPSIVSILSFSDGQFRVEGTA
jgi:hypothetical protein